MIVTRWQAPIVPDKNQISKLFEAEGLQPFEEIYNSGDTVKDHRHPFDEARMVCTGQLMLDVAGNKLLLRAGDRITIPSNTKHSKKVESEEGCLCICAYKTY